VGMRRGGEPSTGRSEELEDLEGGKCFWSEMKWVD
jgi:hypothetical protein